MHESNWIPAVDTTRIVQSGAWHATRFRYAEADHLMSDEDRASLTCRFEGTGLVLRLGDHAVPAYGTPNLGKLVVTVDNGAPRTLCPLDVPREVVLAQGLADGAHRVHIEHRAEGSGRGCRIEGFRTLKGPSGDIGFTVCGEENAHFVDARAVLKRGGAEVRNIRVRNWLTGGCRLAGLPPGDGYSLELHASGWEPQRTDDIVVVENEETVLPPIYLRREEATRLKRMRFPAPGRPAIRLPGETFRVRLVGYGAQIDGVRLQRHVGPATISRMLSFEEDASAAFYYDREIVAALPGDMPRGLYDLAVTLSHSGRAGVCRSPRSVHVVAAYPENPVFMTFGHLDTWGQVQAEHLRRLAEIANLLAPDMVLNSNAVNPAYISGALADLQMPYAITFGNHQFHGHEKWYGEPVGLIDYGPDLCLLNFGLPWHTDLSKADALLSSRAGARHKVINAFEHNAPVGAFLDRHRVNLIHDAHGPGEKVMSIGATPTLRVGKINSNSFRMVRFRDGRVASCTYRGDAVAPIPFDREGEPPLRVAYTPANDGAHAPVTATVTNALEESYPDCRLTFVLPRGTYVADRGRVETAVVSDDGRHTVLTVRVDLPEKDTISVTVRARE